MLLLYRCSVDSASKHLLRVPWDPFKCTSYFQSVCCNKGTVCICMHALGLSLKQMSLTKQSAEACRLAVLAIYRKHADGPIFSIQINECPSTGNSLTLARTKHTLPYSNMLLADYFCIIIYSLVRVGRK